MSHQRTATPERLSILAELRALVPHRPLNLFEARRVSERQADRLRQLTGVTTPELPDDCISSLPRVVVREMLLLPTSGSSQWSEGQWVIAINGREPWQRQRFSTGHELWHVINHQTSHWLCQPTRTASAYDTGEHLADYFAGCLYMPRRIVRSLLTEGYGPDDLADLLGVSLRAIEVRLSQLHLLDSLPERTVAA